MVKILMLSRVSTSDIRHATTPSPTPSAVPSVETSLTTDGVGASLILFALIVIALGLLMFVTRRRRFRDLAIFGALMAAIASLVLVAAIVWLIALLALGFPRFPSPSQLTLNQLGGVVQIGLSVAAAVGVAVALLVAYRKQRDSEAVREADLFKIAVEQLGSDQYFMRLAGVLALRDLGDRWEPWRQRSLDMLCVALVQSEESAAGLRRTIYEILRERFNERSHGWRKCSITIAHGEIPDLDLSNLWLSCGTLTLRDITLSQPTNLSSIQLSGDARLVLDGIRLTNTLNLNGVVCQGNSGIEMNEILIGANGTLDFSKTQITQGGTVRVRNVNALDGGQFGARSLSVSGSLDLSDLTCASGALIDLTRLTCNAGHVSVTNVDAPDCGLTLSGVRVLNGGYLRIDNFSGDGGRLCLDGGRVTEGSVVSLTNIMVYNGARLDLQQLYNKSGSLFYANVVVNAGVVNLAAFENEDEGSVFVLRALMEGTTGRVQFRGGGNYDGDVHIEAHNHDKSVPAGTFSFENVTVSGGQIDLRLRHAVEVRASNLRMDRSELVVNAAPDVLRKLYRATQAADVRRSSTSHRWSEHLTHSPLGRPVDWTDGELEK